MSAPMSGSRKSDAWSGMGIGWAITSTMIGGIATLGGLGYLLDRLLEYGNRVHGARHRPRGGRAGSTSCICGTGGEASDDHG